eukprot:14675-Heterococcus_DN1.PRE.18
MPPASYHAIVHFDCFRVQTASSSSSSSTEAVHTLGIADDGDEELELLEDTSSLASIGSGSAVVNPAVKGEQVRLHYTSFSYNKYACNVNPQILCYVPRCFSTVNCIISAFVLFFCFLLATGALIVAEDGCGTSNDNHADTFDDKVAKATTAGEKRKAHVVEAVETDDVHEEQLEQQQQQPQQQQEQQQQHQQEQQEQHQPVPEDAYQHEAQISAHTSNSYADSTAAKPSLPLKVPQLQQQQAHQQLAVPVIDLTSTVLPPANAFISNSISNTSSSSMIGSSSSDSSSGSSYNVVARPDTVALFADLKEIDSAGGGISKNGLVGGTFIQLQNKEQSYIQLLQQQQRTVPAASRAAVSTVGHKSYSTVSATARISSSNSTATAAKAATVSATTSSRAGVSERYSSSGGVTSSSSSGSSSAIVNAAVAPLGRRLNGKSKSKRPKLDGGTAVAATVATVTAGALRTLCSASMPLRLVQQQQQQQQTVQHAIQQHIVQQQQLVPRQKPRCSKLSKDSAAAMSYTPAAPAAHIDAATGKAKTEYQLQIERLAQQQLIELGGLNPYDVKCMMYGGAYVQDDEPVATTATTTMRSEESGLRKAGKSNGCTATVEYQQSAVRKHSSSGQSNDVQLSTNAGLSQRSSSGAAAAVTNVVDRVSVVDAADDSSASSATGSTSSGETDDDIVASDASDRARAANNAVHSRLDGTIHGDLNAVVDEDVVDDTLNDEQAAADIAEFLGALKAKYAPTTSSSNAELSVAAVKAAFNAFAERYTDLTDEGLQPYFQFAQRLIQQLYAQHADAADNMAFVLKFDAATKELEICEYTMSAAGGTIPQELLQCSAKSMFALMNEKHRLSVAQLYCNSMKRAALMLYIATAATTTAALTICCSAMALLLRAP